MRAFGLTGNIGCGKSTVASLLSTHPDVLIVDCDQIAKDVIVDERHKAALSSMLGAEVFANGQADLAAIAKIIFSQPDKKAQLEAFVHPIVWAMAEQQVNSADKDTVCVVESAIIYETASQDKFISVIVVTCNPEEQFRRLRESRGMSDEQIRDRLSGQLPSAEKEAQAQFVIHTDCSLDQLKDRADELYRNLKQHS